MTGVESEPFARGGFGVIHRAIFQGEVVALKKLVMSGMSAPTREKIYRDFASELTIMTKLVRKLTPPSTYTYLSSTHFSLTPPTTPCTQAAYLPPAYLQPTNPHTHTPHPTHHSVRLGSSPSLAS